MKNAKRAVALAVVLALAGLGVAPAALAQNRRPYRFGDAYMRGVINRIETRTDRFSNLLPNALDRSRVNGSAREDDVNRLVTDFEHATDQLKQHFNNGSSTQADVQAVLREGARINTFMHNHRLDYRTERAWTQVKNELDSLASAYGVARNWETAYSNTDGWPTPTSGPVAQGYDAMLTGTYRLNASRSNDPRTVADSATQYLGYDQRQRIYDNLINRLTPPETIAVERHGNSVTLASTRSPRVTFDVDGRERLETYPNGRASHVRANFYGGELKVVANGDRANDFTATFTPVDGGRRLLVTREVYAERLARPVTVRSYYDRVSDVAQWDVYNNGSAYIPGNQTAAGDFVVPDGTQLVAVLDDNLSTRYVHEGDLFTMTVRSPAQFNGATLEGHVQNVSRGGRVAGRSGMTFNFDSIRLRDGRTYNFAGVVENVAATNGETVRVDNEGALQEGENRTDTTLERTAIGTAVGAIIGALAGGGKDAAIGAAVGAGAGAGSVYVQGRDDLDLMSGTQMTIRASAPGYVGAR